MAAAHSARLYRYMLDGVVDPRKLSDLAGDDAGYPYEKASAWVRSYLVSALDHLLLWANVVAPQQVYDGMEVQNPPRPYFTLARAALESAAQAVWVLEQETSTDRVHRHLRLLYHDLRQLALALETQDDARVAQVRERMANMEQRTAGVYAFDSITRAEPKYLMIVRECSSAIDMDPDDLEAVWRGASAAAHGKNWFQHVGYRAEVGEEYEPGYYRVMLTPDPGEITRTVEAAAAMVARGVVRFVLSAGYNPAALWKPAMARLAQETPLKPGAEWPAGFATEAPTFTAASPDGAGSR